MRLTRLFSGLRFRTRLALVMFLAMAGTSAVLVATYVRQERRVKAYVTGITSDLVTISQLAAYQQQIPQKGDPKLALQAYIDALNKAGLKVDATSPSGEVVASTDPKQLKKRISLRKRPPREDPFHISASLPDIEVDPGGQTTYSVQFPVVRNDKVLGYIVVHGVGDEVDQLLRHTDEVRSAGIIVTLLAGLFAVAYLAFLFTRPIDSLVTGATQVAQGNLYVSLPEAGPDEMARLARTFNQMVERLRESRRLQERLNEAEKLSLLGRFAATVAHEVKNSLNFINLSIDHIRDKHLELGASSREIERNLFKVKDEIGRLNRLVNDFLAAGRQSPPEFARCDVANTLQEAVTLVEKQARLQDISVTVDLPPDLPTLQADAGQLKTCFLNILTNAVQAMPEGGKIQVSSAYPAPSRGPERLQLRFVDSGPGVRPEDRERIFAPYFSTKTTGFGLGLAITRKIIEDHGGRIYATAGETRGTVMVVELPLTRVTGGEAETREAATRSQKSVA